jgi:hypothetical protein
MIAEAALDKLQKIPGYEEEAAATTLKANAQKAWDLLGGSTEEVKTARTIGSASDEQPNDAKSQAEARLQEMLKKAQE